MKSPDVAALSKDTPVVVPIAALEQHGGHMPLFTDSLLCGEVVRRTAERLKDNVVFTPLIWLGNSHHHLDFAGTLSAEPRTYLDTLVGVFENLIHHGFKRLVFFNGHGATAVTCCCSPRRTGASGRNRARSTAASARTAWATAARSRPP
jgi:creatinine amidohydrolase